MFSILHERTWSGLKRRKAFDAREGRQLLRFSANIKRELLALGKNVPNNFIFQLPRLIFAHAFVTIKTLFRKCFIIQKMFPMRAKRGLCSLQFTRSGSNSRRAWATMSCKMLAALEEAFFFNLISDLISWWKWGQAPVTASSRIKPFQLKLNVSADWKFIQHSPNDATSWSQCNADSRFSHS